ncbi:hypothetical protein EZI54_03320 [Marinobacter halodurans]|uniref:DUF4878 domain-containing protein n=1 Tax=Marinobacter halodurans TaxID=2528979 RepID=A0ABY1ZRV5_9GAMM|nr:hypothetical protein [Marinobacter halodurans]TBW58429.1 hypothetical protein EZI54_03320 [Marinobacter halodurans]
MRAIKCFSLVLLGTLMLSACGGPETPQDVSTAFWQSVIDGDADAVADLSTLDDVSRFDGFGQQDWKGVTATIGRIVIEGPTARITTRLDGLKDHGDKPLETTTYLVKEDGDWQVDYAHTKEAFTNRPLFDQMMRKLEDFGEQMRSSFSDSSDQAARDIERMSAQLQDRMAAANEDFSRQMDAFAEKLDQALEALSESISNALEDNPQASPQDRQTLQQAVIRLDENREELDDPTVQSVADSSRTLAQVQLSLNRLGDRFAAYQKAWSEQVKQVEQEMTRLTRGS